MNNLMKWVVGVLCVLLVGALMGWRGEYVRAHRVKAEAVEWRALREMLARDQEDIQTLWNWCSDLEDALKEMSAGAGD